jgi:16S rRNA (guanine527-N7)-methyltransferase
MAFLDLDMLKSGCSDLWLELTDEQLRVLDEFASLMCDCNTRFNLTRITEPQAIVTNHYLDSLTCLSAIRLHEGASVVDVGTGAGFPGIPIKVVRPDVRVTFMDSTVKKLDFIKDAAASLGIDGVDFAHARAEDAGHKRQHREHYDAAFARALADMSVLAEFCLPLVRVGGQVIAQKSDGIEKELDAARPIIGELGGVVEKIARVHLPHTEIVRTIVVITKTKLCPQMFPRPYPSILAGKGKRTGHVHA